MATIDSLANETLSHIIELLMGPPLPDWDNSGERPKGRYDALRAAALVCARWRDPAQRALFDELHLPDPSDSRGPLFCASAARPRYRTRSLLAQSDGSLGDWLPIAMECVGLESLNVQDDTIYFGEDRMSWGTLALPAFSGLRHLRLLFPENFQDPHDIAVTLPFQLSSLALWLDDDGSKRDASLSSISPRFIDALCAASLPNLSRLSLHISNLTSGAPFFPSFTLLGPRLRTLNLSAAGEAFQGHFHLFQILESLKYLDINLAREQGAEEEPAEFEFLGAVLDALPSPPTLRHLRIKLRRIPIDNSLELVSKNRSLESIVRLELWGFDEKASLGEKQEVGLEAARSVLAERGAVIVLGGV